MKDSLVQNIADAFKPLGVTASTLTIADINTALGTLATCLSIAYAIIKLIKTKNKTE